MTPAFLTELLEDETLDRIQRMGIVAGYAMPLLLAIFVVLFRWQNLVGDTMPLLVFFVPLKLVTNTVMWWSLRTKNHRLFWIIVNQLSDIIGITATVYFTGGPGSPLSSLYLLVLGVIAAFSNTGMTIATAVAMLTLYALMLSAVAIGWAPLTPPLLQNVYQNTGMTWAVVVLDLTKLMAMFAILAGTITSMVRTLRRKEAELRQTNLELIEASQLRAEFVANMTHELRTPIHGVLGLTEMLDYGVYGALNKKQAVALENINRSATGLLDMIDNLLSLERVESGRLSIRVMQADIRSILEDAANTARWMAGTKHLEISVEFSSDVDRAFTDATLLEHILVNLVSNAVKFTHEGGWVVLRARSQATTLLIEVQDNGIGIDEAHRERVFQAFRQVDASPSREFGGAGLGLSIVAQLAGLLEASVDFESTPGEGTTFTIAIPHSVITE